MLSRRLSAIGGIVLVLMVLVVPLLPTPAAAAQLRSRSFETEDGQHAVEWTREWEADEELTSEDDDVAMVTLTSGSTMFALMLTPSFGLDVEEVFDVFHESFLDGMGVEVTGIDRWESRGVIHSLEVADLGGFEMAVYMQVEETAGGDIRMSIVASPSASIERDVTSIQADITVDGDAALPGVDGSELADLIDGGGEARDPGSERTSAGAGGQYTDEAYGYTVSWTEGWEAGGETQLALIGLEAEVTFTGMSTAGMDRAGFLTILRAMGGDNTGMGAQLLGVVDGDDRYLIATELQSGDVLLREVVFLSGGEVVVASAVIPEGNEGVIERVQEGIEIEGEPVFRDWEEL